VKLGQDRMRDLAAAEPSREVAEFECALIRLRTCERMFARAM